MLVVRQAHHERCVKRSRPRHTRTHLRNLFVLSHCHRHRRVLTTEARRHGSWSARRKTPNASPPPRSGGSAHDEHGERKGESLMAPCVPRARRERLVGRLRRPMRDALPSSVSRWLCGLESCPRALPRNIDSNAETDEGRPRDERRTTKVGDTSVSWNMSAIVNYMGRHTF